MAAYTDDVLSECEKDVVFALDVIDRKRELFRTHVSFSELLADCECGPMTCPKLESWINKKRRAAGKANLAKGTIKPSLKISEVMDHVC